MITTIRNRLQATCLPAVIVRLYGMTLLLSILGADSPASDREAAQQVREGVRLHQAGNFEQAAKAFSKAAEALPADPRVAFNQGCALAAQGKHEEAESRLRDAALARDSDLAAAAYYNLGCLAADQMKAVFGQQPEEVVAPTREEGLVLLRTAVDHYRQALREDPQHTAARRNLELLRMWNKHIQDRWAERDRQRRRDAMNLLEYLAWLQSEQRTMRSQAKGLPISLNSPTLRQTARKLSTAQRDLTLEIEPLKAKLDQALQPPAEPTPPAAQPPATQPSVAAPPPRTPEMQQAQQVLHRLADQSGDAMTHAADELGNRRVAEAITAQAKVLPPLNQLFELLAPFDALLRSAIKSETGLVASSTAASAAAPDAGESDSETESSQETDPSRDVTGQAGATAKARLDSEEAAEEQRFVSGWSEMLIRKAEQLLAESQVDVGAGVDPMPDAEGATEIPLPNPAAETPSSDTPSTDAETTGTATAASSEPAASPPTDPRAAYEKAIELGPRIKQLTSQAADDLQQDAWSAALPQQEEALRLLKEIAALLPPQEQQDNQEQQDQEKPDDQQQDDQQQDQDQSQDDKQDKASDDEEKKREQDKSDSKQKDEADKKQSDEDQEKQQQDGPSEQQEDLSRQQAESLLRQVRQREREHRELEKELRRLLRSRIIVERDW